MPLKGRVKLYFRYIFITIILSLFYSYCYADQENKDLNKDIEVIVVSTNQKISKSEGIDRYQNYSEDYIDISSAKNETNNFQIILRTKKSIKDVKLTAHFTRVALSKSIDFFPFSIEYKKVLQKDATREWPDILRPIGAVHLVPNINNVIWGQLSIQETISAGAYNGELLIEKHDSVLKRVPIRIKVFDFQLPAESDLQILAKIKYVKKIKDVKKLVKNLKFHGINGLTGYPFPKRIDAGSSNEDLLKFIFDELNYKYTRIPNAYIGHHRLKANRWGDQEIFHNNELAEGFKRKYIDVLQSSMTIYSQYGWQDKVQIKLFDEPADKYFPKIQKLYKLAKDHLSHIPSEISRAPYQRYKGIIDIWNFHPKYYDAHTIRDIQRSNGKVTLYHNDFHQVNQTSNTMRLIPWILWKYSFDGYYFYAVNDWKAGNIQEEANLKNHYFNGILVYQDNNGLLLNSIRMEQFKRGMEDYKYLMLIKDKMMHSTNKKLKHKVETHLDEVMTQFDIKGFTRAQLNFDGIKRMLGEYIEQL